VREGEVKEVILATDPDMEGEATALYVREALDGLPVRLTRLARGLPTGSQLEYADGAILTDALEGRREMSKQ
jgi:recombination protein RecR